MILLAGATGQLGGAIARELAAHGAHVRALVREGADPTALERLGTEVVRGDVRDPESLERAATGVRTVVSGATAIGRMLAGSEGRTGLRDVDARGNLALLEAAERAGADRFVFVSAGGVERVPHMPLARAKLAVEERLRASPLREVVVRPDAFQEVWLTPVSGLDWPNGRLSIFGRGETRVRYVATADVAAAVAAWAVAVDPPRNVGLGGPEALTRNEVAELVEQAAGRSLKRRRVPRVALQVGSRLLARPKPAVASLLGLALMMDLGDVPWDDEPLRALGIEPRSPRAFLTEAVGGTTT